MLIDWFTVVAQALNFLILVWLMKRFLFKPVLAAIDAREKRIADELASADAKQLEAKNEKDEFARKNQEFDAQKTALLTQAAEAAKGEQAKLRDEASKAAIALEASGREALLKQASDLNQSVARRTRQEIFAIARKLLSDLSSVSLESRIAEVFGERLRALPGPDRDKFKPAPGSAEIAVITSAFELLPDQRAVIQKACNETFSAAVGIRYQTSPELIGGIEFSWNGQKVAWSVADQLKSLEETVDEISKSTPNAPPKEAAAA
jgi:F-type H+-transporting ATPase subunit b